MQEFFEWFLVVDVIRLLNDLATLIHTNPIHALNPWSISRPYHAIDQFEFSFEVVGSHKGSSQDLLLGRRVVSFAPQDGSLYRRSSELTHWVFQFLFVCIALILLVLLIIGVHTEVVVGYWCVILRVYYGDFPWIVKLTRSFVLLGRVLNLLLHDNEIPPVLWEELLSKSTEVPSFAIAFVVW